MPANVNGQNQQRSNRSELIIDKHALDREVCEQSARLNDVGQEAARLASVRDSAKDRAKVVAAERAIAIRAELTDSGGRVTESQIEARLMTDADRIDAQRDLIQAERDCAEAEARRDAWRERGYMLRTLADLYASGYWASASLAGDRRAAEEREGDVARQAVATQRRRLNSSQRP